MSHIARFFARLLRHIVVLILAGNNVGPIPELTSKHLAQFERRFLAVLNQQPWVGQVESDCSGKDLELTQVKFLSEGSAVGCYWRAES